MASATFSTASGLNHMRVRSTMVVMAAFFALGVVVGMLVLVGGGDAHEAAHVHDGLAFLVKLRLFRPAVVAGAVEHHDVCLGELGQIGCGGLIKRRFAPAGDGIRKEMGERTYAAGLWSGPSSCCYET